MLACIVLIILGALLMAVVAGYARELKRLARVLADSSPNGNERVDVASSLPGCAQLAQAMHWEMSVTAAGWYPLRLILA